MEVSSQFHGPDALPLGKELPGSHWIGGWVGPIDGLDAVKKRKISAPARNQILAVQPVARGYIEL
jgi:hypothetical protein